jgi:hypothetical protein
MVLPGVFIGSPFLEPEYEKSGKKRAKAPRGVKISYGFHLTRGVKAMSGEWRN